jgi:hypothetical protein
MSPNRMDDLMLNIRKVNVAMRRILEGWNKIKERIKRRMRSERIKETEGESDEPACPDWILTNDGECFARKKASFTKYNTIDITAGEKHERKRQGIRRLFHSAPRGGGSVPPGRNKVIGIGDVELTVKRRRNKNDLTTSSLKLENVLHLPDSPCNGFNPGMLPECKTTTVWEGKVEYTEGLDIDNNPWWHAKPFHGTMRLVLGEDPLGKSVFKKNTVPPRDLNVVLNEGEQDVIDGFLKKRGGALKAPVPVDERAVCPTSGSEETPAPGPAEIIWQGSSSGPSGGVAPPNELYGKRAL